MRILRAGSAASPESSAILIPVKTRNPPKSQTIQCSCISNDPSATKMARNTRAPRMP